MDTQRMDDETKSHHLAISLVFDPSADESERWVAIVDFDYFGAASTADEALDEAMNREALGPVSTMNPDPKTWEAEPAIFGTALDDDGFEDPSVTVGYRVKTRPKLHQGEGYLTRLTPTNSQSEIGGTKRRYEGG